MLLGCQNDHTSHTYCTFQKKKSFKNKYSSIASKQHLPPLLPLQPHVLCPGSAWSLLFCFMSTVSSWVSSSLIYLYLVHFPLHRQEWTFYKTDPAMSPFWLKQDPVCCPQDSCEFSTWLPRPLYLPTELSLAPSPLTMHILVSPSCELAARHHAVSRMRFCTFPYLCSFGLMVLCSCPDSCSDFPFPFELAQIAHLRLKLSLIY